LDQINIGSDISFWFGVIQIVITILLITKVGFTAYHYIKGGLKEKENWQKYKKLLFYVIVMIVILFVMFVGYGKGSMKLQSKSGLIGHTQMQEEVPEENIDSVRKITEEEKPHSLKRQEDPGFSEEQEEAEKYLKSQGLD
jgi:Tfp pilus assembly protein PilO